jgi:hypothetical protein
MTKLLAHDFVACVAWVCVLHTLAAEVGGVELLSGKWAPVFEEDTIATSSVTWVYADFIPRNASYVRSKVLTVPDEECKEMCALAPDCVGVAFAPDKCSYYEDGPGTRVTVDMLYNERPRAVTFEFLHRRKIPPYGLLVQVKVVNGTLNTPAAPLVEGLYQISTRQPALSLNIHFQGHPVKLQFVLGPDTRITHRQVSSKESERVAAGVSALLAVLTVAAFILVLHKKSV